MNTHSRFSSAAWWSASSHNPAVMTFTAGYATGYGPTDPTGSPTSGASTVNSFSGAGSGHRQPRWLELVGLRPAQALVIGDELQQLASELLLV